MHQYHSWREKVFPVWALSSSTALQSMVKCFAQGQGSIKKKENTEQKKTEIVWYKYELTPIKVALQH